MNNEVTAKAPFLARGKKDAPILVIVDPPSLECHKQGKVISAVHLNFFATLATSMEFQGSDFTFLSCSPYMPDQVFASKAKQNVWLKDCREQFLSILSEYNPKMILTLGGLAAQQIAGKAIKITKARGQIIKYDDLPPVLHTLGIGYVQKSPQNEPTFITDFAMMKKFQESNFETADMRKNNNVDYQWCTDLSEWRRNPPAYMFVDTETTGLDWTLDSVFPFTVQLCREPGKAIMVPCYESYYPELERDHGQLMADLKWLLENPSIKKFGHHMKFDYHMLKKIGITMENWWFDTLQGAFAVDENQTSLSQAECVRRYIPEMAGYCVVPETKLLTSDMRWVEAGSVKEGDRLVGFDEYPESKGRRKLQDATVLSSMRLLKPCYKITMRSGREITVSDNHQFLKVRKLHGGGMLNWKQTFELKVGDQLAIFPCEQYQNTYDSGYLAGLFDGEGWVQGGEGSFKTGIAQNPGLVLDSIYQSLSNLNLVHTSTASSKLKNNTVNVYLNGWESYKLLQSCRPKRLIDKKTWVGRPLPSGVNQKDEIIALEYVGIKEVVALKTTSHTFIAEGICSHNSDEFDARIDKSKMMLVDPDELLEYGCGDADSGLRLVIYLQKELAKDARQFYLFRHVQMPALRVFADTLESNGMFVDETMLQEFGDTLAKGEAEMYERLIKQVPASIKRKHIEEFVAKKKPPEKALQFSRAAFVIDILFSKEGFGFKPVVFTDSTKRLEPSKRVPSTSAKDHLPYFQEHQFVVELMEYQKLQKMRSTYVGVKADEDGEPTGFWQYIRNGKIYPSYDLHKTATGRTASSNPNGQNLPKRGTYAKAYRKMFVAPPGWKLVQCDYSQAELRFVAWMANEPTMLEAYRQGRDLHAVTAAGMMNISYEQFHQLDEKTIEQKRYEAKAPNFGLIYLMSPAGFKEYAWVNYGLTISLKEAEAQVSKFFKTYKLAPWQQAMIRKCKEKKYVRGLHGALRRLPNVDSKDSALRALAERQSVNTTIQRIASDMGVIALTRLHNDIRMSGEDIPIKFCMFIHDALVALVREDYLEEGMSTIKWYMERNPLDKMFGLTPPIPFTVDVEAGDNLGELQKQKHVIAQCPAWYSGDRVYDRAS